MQESFPYPVGSSHNRELQNFTFLLLAAALSSLAASLHNLKPLVPPPSLLGSTAIKPRHTSPYESFFVAFYLLSLLRVIPYQLPALPYGLNPLLKVRPQLLHCLTHGELLQQALQGS